MKEKNGEVVYELTGLADPREHPRTEGPKPRERKVSVAPEPPEPVPPSTIVINRSGVFQKTARKVFWHATVNPIRDTRVPARNGQGTLQLCALVYSWLTD